jgi:hypothetical protein
MKLKLQINNSKPQALPHDVIQELAKHYSGMRDLEHRLWKLPLIKKGKQRDVYPNTNVSQYAVRAAEFEKLRLFIGYFVYRHPQTRKWQLHEHVFCVDSKDRVQEMASGFEWPQPCYYVGMEVPVDDYKNLRFVNKFSLMSYINAHSARALFDPPQEEDNDEDEG